MDTWLVESFWERGHRFSQVVQASDSFTACKSVYCGLCVGHYIDGIQYYTFKTDNSESVLVRGTKQ